MCHIRKNSSFTQNELSYLVFAEPKSRPGSESIKTTRVVWNSASGISRMLLKARCSAHRLQLRLSDLQLRGTDNGCALFSHNAIITFSTRSCILHIISFLKTTFSKRIVHIDFIYPSKGESFKLLYSW